MDLINKFWADYERKRYSSAKCVRWNIVTILTITSNSENITDYYSAFQSHFSIKRAGMLLGIGLDNVVLVKSDDRYVAKEFIHIVSFVNSAKAQHQNLFMNPVWNQ